MVVIGEIDMEPTLAQTLTSDPSRWDAIRQDLHEVNILGPWESGTRESVTRHSKGFAHVKVSPFVDWDAGEPYNFGFEWVVMGRDLTPPNGKVSAPDSLIGLFVNGDPMTSPEAIRLFDQAKEEADAFMASGGWLLQ